jgi:hypothetical protein
MLKLGRTHFKKEFAHPPFWNVSALLISYVDALIELSSRSARTNRDANRLRMNFPSETLAQAWEKAFEADTIESAIESYQVIAELLATEIDRIQALAGPSIAGTSILDCLRCQQSECAQNVLRLRDALRTNDLVIWSVSD